MVVLAHDFCACHWVWCLVFSVSPQMFLLMNLAFAVGQLGDGRPIYGIMLKCRKHIYMYIIVYIYIYIFIYLYMCFVYMLFSLMEVQVLGFFCVEFMICWHCQGRKDHKNQAKLGRWDKFSMQFPTFRPLFCARMGSNETSTRDA